MIPRHLYIREWENGALSVYTEPVVGAVEYIAEECVEECAHCLVKEWRPHQLSVPYSGSEKP